jgi:5-(carboxyamino)imidazole ribonucleotide mutase
MMAEATKKIDVGIIMGSKSDWPAMEAAAKVLDELGIAYEAQVISAHRTPDKTLQYAESAKSRGLRVIIAGAGGAAHLAGFVAAKTTLPVLGVPMKSSALNGLDSLLSIVQMPAGVPVATVSVGGARNAGLLAVRILAAGADPAAQALRTAMTAFQERLREEATAKGERLRARRAGGASLGFGAR